MYRSPVLASVVMPAEETSLEEDMVDDCLDVSLSLFLCRAGLDQRQGSQEKGELGEKVYRMWNLEKERKS